MVISDTHNNRLATFFQFSLLVLVLAASVLIISITVRNQRALDERLTALERMVQEQFAGQTGLLLDSERKTAETLLSALDTEVTEMTAEIDRLITAGTAATRNRINQTNNRIQEIHTVYSNLLAEQQKQTLDSVYTQQALIEKEQEAARLFREGKYAMANVQYAAIAQAQPENTEARFYQLYSLFMNNKLDRGNYRLIKEGLQALERNGYHRAEIKETLDFIASEEGGR